MESFRLVCRTPRGEWYMHDAQADHALAAFERLVAAGQAPHLVIPERLGRGLENTIVQRWKGGASEAVRCLNCDYDLKGLVRASDSFALCPECGVGAIMRPLPPEPESPPASAPNFKPGAILAVWGVAFSLLGFLFFPTAVLGITLGAFAYEYSKGVRGIWAMRIGTASLVIGFLLYFAGAFRF
jgi:hypothetical protein